MARTISVIIPVYNGSATIKRCLDACLDQDGMDPDDYEIIVIDNGSTDTTVDVVRNYMRNHTNIVLVNEGMRSSYAARNKGISISQGRYLVFTDADCIPSNKWLSSYLKCVERIESSGERSFLIGGAIEVVIKDGNNAWEVYDKVHFLNQEIFVMKKGFAATANLLVERSVFESVGPFNCNLVSGGDLEFGKRATEKFNIYYCPEAKIYHDSRDTMQRVLKKNYRIAFGFAQLHMVKYHKKIPGREIIRHLIPNIGLLKPEYFPRFVPETSYSIPEGNGLRLKLFIIDILSRILQFLGRCDGNRYDAETGPVSKRIQGC